MSLKIVILDGYLANPGDISWTPVEQHGQLTVFDQTPPGQVIVRAEGADILLINKVRLNNTHFEQLPKLKLICLLATGYDNVDIKSAEKKGIVVCNAVDYGSESVAQHVFAMILACTNQVAQHNTSIQNGDWFDNSWSFTLTSLRSLNEKTLGIFGMGKIGNRVAEIAQAFGMRILAVKRNPPNNADSSINYVTPEILFRESDFISLHAPLNKQTRGVINSDTLAQMKSDAVLVNTARGGLIVEEDFRKHLEIHPDFMALLDVLSVEPPPRDHPLIGLPNCILTPHNAWSNIDARSKLIQIVSKNIEQFVKGAPINVVTD